MTRLPLFALFALVAAAGFGAVEMLRALAPTMPDEMRGFVAACLAIAAGAMVVDKVTA
ncbi:MAG: hypothetical protein Q8S38_03165 [Bosea sp. (in: a-proteobacteria)]|nr:hypothetical protein [Bosea sp. (in: a-proteobacteria)]